MLRSCLLMLLVYAALMMFAVPRVMFDSVEPFTAMKESLAASLANVGALLIYVIIMFVAACLGGVVLGLIPILGPLVLMLALTMVAGGAVYYAYKDVFGGASAPIVPPAPPPAP